ncbi:hypothetical protein [Asaia krungthepensis]|uniref:Uncharacterized protein n=1 Tax=Asaia krungthepensis NRIC 0535 TaxID=1307925 RepID=A0ABQ0Q352_9PROT|nr:hypothetical protein [Asaia krungthepensis]GBQ89131.1 hypothetical protein AA0535_1720 [Asaia krungthepensis NRIC 0535]
MTHKQKPESKKYAPEIMGLAVRIHGLFQDGNDRGDVSDFEKLVDAGLMTEGVHSENCQSDSLEAGETVWIFTPEGLSTVRLFKEGAGQ